MEAMIEAIKLAVLDEASDEAKRAGAEACRTLLAALEAEPGSALVPPSAPGSALAGANPGPALAMRSTPPTNLLAGLDVTQILDLVIAKLRSAVGEEIAEARSAEGYNVQLIPVPGRK